MTNNIEKKLMTIEPSRPAIIASMKEFIADFLSQKVKFNPGARDSYKNTPLMHAARFIPDIVGSLIEAGVDVNAQNYRGETALMFAVETNPRIVVTLLKAGADPNIQNHEGQTALMKAAQYQPIIMQDLINSGADPTAIDKELNSVFLKAIMNEKNDELALKSLIQAGANINAKDKDGYTPLMYTAQSRPNLIKFLVEHGVDINAVDVDGCSALFLAMSEKPIAVQYLLEAGAEFSSIVNNESLLSKSKSESKKILSIFIAKQEKISIEDELEKKEHKTVRTL